MPIIASATIQINVNEDHTIERLFLNEVSKCGCVNIQSASKLLDVPFDELKDVIGKLVGEKAIECDNDRCCTSESFDSFVNNLNNIKEHR